MAALPQRTIVIRAISPQQSQMLKRPAPTVSPVQVQLTDFKMELPDHDVFDGQAPRKRQRLTNLSPEERMLRRKLKNRVAAQTARDRKKEKMDTLEESLARLQEENKRLQSQNQSLQVQKSSLAQENERLRERLGVVAPPGSVSLVKREPVSTLESAALFTGVGPLQKDLLTRESCQTAVNYSAWLLTSLMCCLASSNKSRPTPTSALSRFPLTTEETMTSSQEVMTSSSQRKRASPRAWWGPQQQSWNPAKN